MKVLWITNVALPIIYEDMGKKVSYGGGWLVSLANDIISQNVADLAVAFPIDCNEEQKKGMCKKITYYAFPCNKGETKKKQENVVKSIKRILMEFDPDIVHIWGTEYVHSYYAAVACEELGIINRVVVSIQGLVSVYADYYFAGIPEKEYRFPTVKELARRTGLKREYQAFRERGKYEIKCLELVKNVIGRTDWDFACTRAINNKRKYFFCNETLRGSFYDAQWELQKCEKHSIFASQAQYPIKGFHKLLKAVALLKKEYPDIKVYTTGKDRNDNSLKTKLSFSTYDRYIHQIISDYNLKDNVVFLGFLSELEMRKMYLRCRVFVSPSAIENSPNSLGEAMILGVPSISSDCGGVKNLMTHEEEGLVYPFNDTYVLSEYIRRLFDDDEMAYQYSHKAKNKAKITHDRNLNLKQMLLIYSKIASENEKNE